MLTTFVTRVSFGMHASVHHGNHGSEHFLRAVLPTNIKAGHLGNGGQWEDKSAHNSTTKVSFSIKIHTFWSAHESDHDIASQNLYRILLTSQTILNVILQIIHPWTMNSSDYSKRGVGVLSSFSLKIGPPTARAKCHPYKCCTTRVSGCKTLLLLHEIS